MNKFIVRDGMESDRNFIFSSWLKGLYFGNDWYEEVPGIIFFKNYQSVIEKILLIPNLKVYVACLPDAEDVILGYAVVCDKVLHWVFVKESWRKFGIAKALVPKDIKQCSHLTLVGRALKRKYAIVYNPFIKECL